MKKQKNTAQVFVLATLLSAAFLSTIAFAPSHAQAEINIEGNVVSAPHQLDFMLGLAPRGGAFGLLPGVFYDLPLLTEKGLAPKLRDSFYIEMGTYLAAYLGTFNTLILFPSVGPRWSLHLTDKVDVFAALKLGASIGLVTASGVFFDIFASVGTHWNFSENLGLRVELGGQRGGINLNAGLTLALAK